MNIKQLIKEAHENAVKKGFYDCSDCNGTGDYFQKKESLLCKCANCKGTGKDPNRNIGELLMLVVSELGEALEAHRKGKIFDKELLKYFYEKNSMVMEDLKARKEYAFYYEDNFKDTFEDEITDVIIRLFDLCGYLDIDIEKHIKLKMTYNKTRPKKHGKEY